MGRKSKDKKIGDSGGGQGLPSETKKLVQSLREIVSDTGCTDEEIYAVLEECAMDPDRAVEILLAQDAYHEVKSKRERRKEVKEAIDSRPRHHDVDLSRGGKISSEPNTHSGSTHATCSELDKAAEKGEFGSVYRSVTSSMTCVVGKDMASDSFRTDNRQQSLGCAGVSSRLQPTLSGVSKGHITMADIVRMGRPSQGAISLHSKGPGVSASTNPESSSSSDYYNQTPQQDSNNERPVIEVGIESHASKLSALSNAPSDRFNPQSNRDSLLRNCVSDEAQVPLRDITSDNVDSGKIEPGFLPSTHPTMNNAGLASHSNYNLWNTSSTNSHSSSDHQKELDKAAEKGEVGSVYPSVTSSMICVVGKDMASDSFRTDNRQQSLGCAGVSSRLQPTLPGVSRGHLTMADIVRIGKPSQGAISLHSKGPGVSASRKPGPSSSSDYYNQNHQQNSNLWNTSSTGSHSSSDHQKDVSLAASDIQQLSLRDPKMEALSTEANSPVVLPSHVQGLTDKYNLSFGRFDMGIHLASAAMPASHASNNGLEEKAAAVDGGSLAQNLDASNSVYHGDKLLGRDVFKEEAIDEEYGFLSTSQQELVRPTSPEATVSDEYATISSISDPILQNSWWMSNRLPFNRPDHQNGNMSTFSREMVMEPRFSLPRRSAHLEDARAQFLRQVEPDVIRGYHPQIQNPQQYLPPVVQQAFSDSSAYGHSPADMNYSHLQNRGEFITCGLTPASGGATFGYGNPVPYNSGSCLPNSSIGPMMPSSNLDVILPSQFTNTQNISLIQQQELRPVPLPQGMHHTYLGQPRQALPQYMTPEQFNLYHPVTGHTAELQRQLGCQDLSSRQSLQFGSTPTSSSQSSHTMPPGWFRR